MLFCIFKQKDEKNTEASISHEQIGITGAKNIFPPDVAQTSAEMMSADQKKIERFLEKIDLLHLSHKFLKHAIMMDDLLDLSHDELKDIGITEVGYRRKSLKLPLLSTKGEKVGF